MMGPRRSVRGAALTAIVLVGAGCSGPGTSAGAGDADPPIPPAATAEDAEVDEGPAPGAPRDPDAADGADGEADTDAMVDEAVPAIDLELPGIDLLTSTSGAGPRPELRWDAVDGADSYLVVLRRDLDGPASWAWRGTATAVVVGPVEQPGLGAPQVEDGMTWSVLALDADNVPIAQSQERPIGP